MGGWMDGTTARGDKKYGREKERNGFIGWWSRIFTTWNGLETKYFLH